MKQNMVIRGKEYEITSIDSTGTKFILTGTSGEQVALGIIDAMLDVYTKQVMAGMDKYSNSEELKNSIMNVEDCLSMNGAYKRMKELSPASSLPKDVVEKRAEDLVSYFTKKYPNRVVTPVENVIPKVENIVEQNETPAILGQEETKEEAIPLNQTVTNNVVEASTKEESDVVESSNVDGNETESKEDIKFVSIQDVNVMLINHDQKIIRQFLMEKYAGYEVNEDFSLARDPRTGEMYRTILNDTGLVQLISTNRDLKQELASTPALSEARIAELNAMSINELRQLRDITTNLAEVNLINEIISGRKASSEFDNTMLIDQEFIEEKVPQKVKNLGFISHLTISFLVGVLGGIALMVVGNSISMFF